MGRNRKQSRKKRIVVILTLLFLFVIMASLCMWFLKSKIEPNLEEIGKIKANIMVSQIVNKALNEQLADQADMDQLLIRKTDDSGQLEVLQANTQAMNLLITEISKELQEEYANREEDAYGVPLGVLLGDKILSQTGPEINIKILPLSISSIDFQTEFESQGINQTKYKVYIDLVSQVKVLAPFASDTFEVSTTLLMAEAVILGNVPNSYVQVPEEDILDVTQE